MPNFGRTRRTPRLLGLSLALVLLGSLIPTASVLAVPLPTVTAATGGGAVSADQTGTSSYTALTGPSITENAAGNLAATKTIVLNVATGFVFRPSGVGVTISSTTATVCDLQTSSVTMTTTTMSVTISQASSVNTCVLTFTGLAVQPTAGTPLAAAADIQNTGTSLAPTGATNYGTLAEAAGAPFAVGFTTQPSSPSLGGAAFSPNQPKVNVEDKFMNPVPGAVVTLTKTPGTPTSGGPGTLACTSNSVATGSPVYSDAQFSGCAIDKIGTGYKLRATSGSAFADSGAITVNLGPKDHLVFTSWPATNTLTTLTPQPAVQVVDLGGNPVTAATDAITLSMIPANDPQFTCSPSKTKNAVAGTGIATFVGCTETVVANNYQLVASAAGLGSATSPAFNVTSGPASNVAICWGATLPCVTTPPTTITGGTAFPTQPVIRLVDAAGNTVVTDSTTVVSLGILAGTPASGGPGTLTCTATSGAVTNGVFALANCSIDKAGTGYRLNATSSGLTSGQSNPFNIVAGPPVKLAFLVQPPVQATALATFPSNIQVAIVDAGGNTVAAGYTATISLAISVNPGGGTLTCSGGTTATTASGVATFPGCSINNQGSGYMLTASVVAVAPSTTIVSANSISFTVLAPAAAITLTAPAVITWGQDMTLNVHFGLNGANKSFTIQVSKDGFSWSNIAGAILTTNASGDASFIYGPSDNRYYRVSFGGTPDLQAGFSNVVRTVVRQINLLRPAHSGYQAISRGTQITFMSTVRPNRPELPQPVVNFVVYQLQGGNWVKVLDRMVGTDRNPTSPNYGRALLLITFNTPAQFYVRSQAVPTVLNANSGWSVPVRYIVR